MSKSNEALLLKLAAEIRAHQNALRLTSPRRGEPWSAAEDRRLLGLLGKRRGRQAVYDAARSLGRTPCAVSTRLYTLNAARRAR